MNSPDNAPAHDHAEIPATATCDYCQTEFEPRRRWQKFCTEPCRRAFEKIIHRMGAKLHPVIREGVRELLAARDIA